MRLNEFEDESESPPNPKDGVSASGESSSTEHSAKDDIAEQPISMTRCAGGSGTEAGDSRSRASPKPRTAPAPQVYSSPSAVRAIECCEPAQTETIGDDENCGIRVGCARAFLSPRPSWPESLDPQAYTRPLLVRAKTCEAPADS